MRTCPTRGFLTTRIPIATVVLLSLITSAAMNGADKSKDVQKASDLLARSRVVVTLGNEGSFHMEATIHTMDENGHPEDGTYNIFFASPDRFREDIVLGNFHQTRVVKGIQEWRKRSVTYLPLRVIQVKDLLPSSPNFAGVPLDAGLNTKEQTERSVKLLCINGLSSDRDNTICIDEQSAEPAYIESDTAWPPQEARMEFQDYAPFGISRRIPRTIVYSAGGKTLIEVHLVKLEALDTNTLAASVFAPLEGIQPIPTCASLKHAEGLGISSGFTYDPSEGEYFAGFGVIGADGKLRDLQTLHSIDAKTDAVAKALLNEGPYTQAKCGGVAVEAESFLLLSGEAIALVSSSKAGIGGYSNISCIHCPPPKYPRDIARANVQGTVVLRCVISAKGRITSISVLRSISTDLDQAAIKAVQKWKFQPAKGPNGRPADASAEIEVWFKLLY
jgi:TonB family protein